MSITALGFAAAFCTTVSFLPQAIKTLKTRKTKDLSLPMYFILAIGIFLWFLYGIFIKDTAIIAANAVTFIFVLPILILKIKNG